MVDTAEPPFTVDEIRSGCPSGRTVRWRVEDAGEAPYLRVSRFLDSDEEGTTLERSRQSLDGAPIGEPDSSRQTWADLQANAVFPAAITTIGSESVETELGRLECLRYTLRDGAEQSSFWFAEDLPGPPVRYEIVVDGRVVSEATVVANG